MIPVDCVELLPRTTSYTDVSLFSPGYFKDSPNQAVWELQSIPPYIFFIILPRNFVREFQQQNLHYGSVVTCTITHTYMQLFYSSRRLNSLRLALFSQSNATEIKHFYYLYLLLCTAISVHSTQRISRCFANDICTGIPSTLKCPGLEGGLQPRK